MVLLNFFDTSKVMIAKQSSEPHSKMRISFSNTSYDIFVKLTIINKYVKITCGVTRRLAG